MGHLIPVSFPFLGKFQITILWSAATLFEKTKCSPLSIHLKFGLSNTLFEFENMHYSIFL